MVHADDVNLFGDNINTIKKNNIEQFKSASKSFLYFNSFYTLDEYFNYKKN
jgi:hypothetical protein